MNAKTYPFLCLFFILLFGCTRPSDQPIEEIFLRADRLSVNLSGIAGKADTLSIESNTSWTATVDPAATWLTISPMQQTGNGKLIVTATKRNNTGTARQTVITLTPVQDAASTPPLKITLSQQSLQGAELLQSSAFGGEAFERLLALEKTPDEGYMLVGGTSSRKGDATASGRKDFWVVRLDKEGKKIWHRTYGGSAAEEAFSIVRTPANNYLIAGETRSSDLQVSENHGGMDGWIVEIDDQGNILWEKTYGGAYGEGLTSIKPTSDGHYIVCGNTYSGDFNTPGEAEPSDAWIMKIDAKGNVVWSKNYGGSGEEEVFEGSTTSDGGYIFTGHVTSTDGDVLDNPSGGRDVWVVKLNAEGNMEWKRYFGKEGCQYGFAIIQTKDGGYLSTGRTTVGTGYGNGDLYVLKLSSDGTLIWKSQFGGSDVDEPYNLLQTEIGDFVVGGFTFSTNHDAADNTGGVDAFVLKIDAEGNLLGSHCFGNSADDRMYRIIDAGAGNFAFVGLTATPPDNYPALNDGNTGWFGMINMP